MPGRVRRVQFAALVAVPVIVFAAGQLEAQRLPNIRSFYNTRVARPDDFDGRFQFCRIEFRNGFVGDITGGSWEVDYPRADINLSIRLSELTKTNISRDDSGVPNNLLLRLTSPQIFQCPFIMMTEVGSAALGDEERAQLRAYLLKGGFLWADDFWGTEAWEWWAGVIEDVLPPPQFKIIDLTPDHPLFRAQFVVREMPQIANIFHWSTYGDGRERDSDSPRANARAILDSHGRIMVLMTHNTDLGDSFEREGDDPAYFLANSVPGYAFGVNALLYAMTH